MVAFFIAFFLFAGSSQSAEWSTEKLKGQGQVPQDKRMLYDDPFNRSDEERIPIYQLRQEKTCCPQWNTWCNKEVNCSCCPRYSRCCYVGLCSALFTVGGLTMLGAYFANKLHLCNDNNKDC